MNQIRSNEGCCSYLRELKIQFVGSMFVCMTIFGGLFCRGADADDDHRCYHYFPCLLDPGSYFTPLFFFFKFIFIRVIIHIIIATHFQLGDLPLFSKWHWSCFTSFLLAFFLFSMVILETKQLFIHGMLFSTPLYKSEQQRITTYI